MCNRTKIVVHDCGGVLSLPIHHQYENKIVIEVVFLLQVYSVSLHEVREIFTYVALQILPRPVLYSKRFVIYHKNRVRCISHFIAAHTILKYIWETGNSHGDQCWISFVLHYVLQRKETNSWNGLPPSCLLFVCLRKPWFSHIYTCSCGLRLLRHLNNRTFSFNSLDFFMDLKSWNQEERHNFSLGPSESVSDERYLLHDYSHNAVCCLFAEESKWIWKKDFVRVYFILKCNKKKKTQCEDWHNIRIRNIIWIGKYGTYENGKSKIITMIT
jgi:hypothetical protein